MWRIVILALAVGLSVGAWAGYRLGADSAADAARAAVEAEAVAATLRADARAQAGEIARAVPDHDCTGWADSERLYLESVTRAMSRELPGTAKPQR